MTTQAEPKKRPARVSQPDPPKVSKKVRDGVDYVLTHRETALRNLAKQ